MALNCVANARILRDTDYRRVWVPPCASDTGAPLGSALWHQHQTLGRQRAFELTHPFYGTTHGDDEIARALGQAGLSYQRLGEAELIAEVACHLAEGQIVGWVQGRFEMGPRALGNRSILADPRSAAMKDKLNARIKQREPFRPFAPAVLVERASEFFEIRPASSNTEQFRAAEKNISSCGLQPGMEWLWSFETARNRPSAARWKSITLSETRRRHSLSGWAFIVAS